MSAKYRRVKEADLALPAPLRWLTRAFSSITLAVILLSIICVYGLFASVPIYMIGLGVAYAIIAACLVGPVALGLHAFRKRLARTNTPWPTWKWLALSLPLLGAAGVLTVWCSRHAKAWAADFEPFAEHRATVIYRLPGIEMTELEFYAWWPMRLLLILFVINMVWATIRRIPFDLPRAGVLTIHSGIVIMALGSLLYGQFKLEGDMFLVRQDIAGPGQSFTQYFYDRNDPALYLSLNGQPATPIPLKGKLPRYNDYTLGELDIAIHDTPGFAQRYTDRLRINIVGFFAYAEMAARLIDLSDTPAVQAGQTAGLAPGLRVAAGDINHAHGEPATLLAGVPDRRALAAGDAIVELLPSLTPERRRDLNETFDGPHGLIVEIPATGFRQVYPITPGQTLTPEGTGYTLQVESIGPYMLPFVTDGYQNAQDTYTLVHITGNGKDIRRHVFHRYPELHTDFLPTDSPTAGPMGQRQDEVDPDIRLTFIDDAVMVYRLVALEGSTDRLELMLRGKGMRPDTALLIEDKFPLPGVAAPGDTQRMPWMHITEKADFALEGFAPTPVPKLARDPKEEGNFTHAVVPVVIEKLAADGKTVEARAERLLRYHTYPDSDQSPQAVNLPGLGELTLTLSRDRYELPFTISLQDFEMTPYPGSDQPRDFASDLLITEVGEDGSLGRPRVLRTHMNNPIMFEPENAPFHMGRIKISQVSWDPGDPDMSEAEKAMTNERGRYVNKHRFSVVGISNNVGVRIIALGAILTFAGIPYAFYVKPWLLKRRARQKVADALNRKPEAQPPAPEPAVPDRDTVPPTTDYTQKQATVPL
ncbi:MAG: hypothetical protein AAF750_12160 [Planctomycetota bacterium]